jgi:hypothetical protein
MERRLSARYQGIPSASNYAGAAGAGLLNAVVPWSRQGDACGLDIDHKALVGTQAMQPYTCASLVETELYDVVIKRLEGNFRLRGKTQRCGAYLDFSSRHRRGRNLVACGQRVVLGGSLPRGSGRRGKGYVSIDVCESADARWRISPERRPERYNRQG